MKKPIFRLIEVATAFISHSSMPIPIWVLQMQACLVVKKGIRFIFCWRIAVC